MKQEEWLRQLKAITMLKLRTGYGRSGNLGGISAYTTMNTVRQNGIVSVNSSPVVTMGMIRNNNPDLKWETRATQLGCRPVVVEQPSRADGGVLLFQDHRYALCL